MSKLLIFCWLLAWLTTSWFGLVNNTFAQIYLSQEAYQAIQNTIDGFEEAINKKDKLDVFFFISPKSQFIFQFYSYYKFIALIYISLLLILVDIVLWILMLIDCIISYTRKQNYKKRILWVITLVFINLIGFGLVWSPAGPLPLLTLYNLLYNLLNSIGLARAIMSPYTSGLQFSLLATWYVILILVNFIGSILYFLIRKTSPKTIEFTPR